MVTLMLDDLGGLSAELLRMPFQLLVLVADTDPLIACRCPHSRKGKTPLFCLVSLFLFRDHRIQHHQIKETERDDDDPLWKADHIRRHADAVVPVRGKRIPQILRDRKIGFCCRRSFFG